jgi:polyhydroxyalkanoate synthesis regulator phasin
MQDAWRAYLEMALGLTEAPRKKAQQVAGELVNRGGATAAQLQGLVDDLMSTGVANREALTNIVRYEVDRALGVVGLASADEVSDLTNRVKDLERQLVQAQARADAAEAAAGATAVPSVVTGPGSEGDRLDKPAPAPGKVAKKAVAKKAVATPNAMPSAATTPGPARKATAASAPAPVKKAAKAALAKKAAPAQTAPATPPATPAGTAEAPTAAVKEAAAATRRRL